MNLEFDNLNSEMAVELLNNKELMIEFCSLIKKLNGRVKELERSNSKLIRFVMLQSKYNEDIKIEKRKNVQTKRKTSIPRKKRVRKSQNQFGDFGWDDKNSFNSF